MDDQPRPSESTVVALAEDPFAAEHLRVVLLAHDLHAGIAYHDPLSMALGIAEILVLSAEHARAMQVLDELRESRKSVDWHCANCSEDGPGNFELCWNCGEERRGRKLRDRTCETGAARGVGNLQPEIMVANAKGPAD